MTIIENLSDEDNECVIELGGLQKWHLMTLPKVDRISVISSMAEDIIKKYGDHYEGTPEYGEVLTEVVSAFYEEFLEDIEIVTEEVE